jgi:hypothetical protein
MTRKKNAGFMIGTDAVFPQIFFLFFLFAVVILEMGWFSLKLFTWAVLESPSSQSQPPK